MELNQLGQLIKKKRQEMGLSQKEVAKLLGLKQSTYSNYENGYSQLPDTILTQLSELLKTDWLIRKDELLNSVDSKKETELFLKGYKNPTEQLLFFDELTEFRKTIDNIENKRARREITDLFSQILDEYLNLFHNAQNFHRKEQKDQLRQNLDLINKELINVMLNLE